MTRIKKEKGLPMACPNCGQPTIEGAKFCASCGSPLTQTTAAAPQAVAPQAAPTQQFQYAPSPAPQPAAAPQPSQPTQQIARPAADPTITALTTP